MCSSSFCRAPCIIGFCRNLSNNSATCTASLLERPLGDSSFYASHSLHRHNTVLPTASLGASGTVLNEATSDLRRFNQNPRFIFKHIKVQVPTSVPTFEMSFPFLGGQTRLNRRTLSRQTSSTRWTPPIWCWLLSTVIGTFAVKVFILFGVNPSFWTLLPLFFNSFFFSSQCRPDLRLCARLLLDPRAHCGHYEQGITFQFGLDIFPVCPVCLCLILHGILIWKFFQIFF